MIRLKYLLEDEDSIEAIRRMTKKQLIKVITLKELERDFHPEKWNAVRKMELNDLKHEYLRRTGKEWNAGKVWGDV